MPQAARKYYPNVDCMVSCENLDLCHKPNTAPMLDFNINLFHQFTAANIKIW